MKIDRLLSIVIYLLNRELVPARELAERFEVTVRTIQRDIETLEMAGIPVMSIQGPHGGYSIMDTYKMDSRMMSLNDFHYIITALKGIGSSLEDRQIDETLEKMTGLVPQSASRQLREKDEKLHIDFSMLGGNEQQRRVLGVIHKAVGSDRLLSFSYTNNKLETSTRTVEPMTIVFKARAWYLYGYCRLKKDYRIFRASKIRDPEVLAKTFTRREKSFQDFENAGNYSVEGEMLDIRLKFDNIMKSVIEGYYSVENFISEDDDHFTVRFRMPDSGWLYGYILSFGPFVEVLEPEYLRIKIRENASRIFDLYE